MKKTHKIGWLNLPGYKGETWNPIIGCSKISEGCENCYAEKMAVRLAHISSTKYYRLVTCRHAHAEPFAWNGKTHLLGLHPIKPLSWKKPRLVFVCSMGDLFHENTSFQDIDKIFATMACCPQHIFIVLTKRAKRMSEYLNDPLTRSNLSYNILKSKNSAYAIEDPLQDSAWPLKNVWVGVSVENQEQLKRVVYLNTIEAEVKFISHEPLLSSIDYSNSSLGESFKYHAGGLKNCVSWVIVGGESGSKARPMHPDWVRSVRDQCAEANTPFFFKQWGEYKPVSINRTGIQPYNSKSNPYTLYTNKAGDIFELVDKDGEFLVCGDSDNEYYQSIQKVGKKHAGNVLDGEQYEAYPIIK